MPGAGENKQIFFAALRGAGELFQLIIDYLELDPLL